MIDCHVHTMRSHHGEGDLEEFVQAALDMKLKLLGFTEHAPLPFDGEHRLTEAETSLFIKEISRLQKKYGQHLKIVGGLEVDYVPSEVSYLRNMLKKFSLDFVYGAIHFIETKEGQVSVWDYPELQNESLWKRYFSQLRKAAESSFFDGLAHPDLILRSGLSQNKALPFLRQQIDFCRGHNIAYEANCSGITKSSYDPRTKNMVQGSRSFPNFEALKYAFNRGVSITIGSDAHSPDKLASNISYVLGELLRNGVRRITYFEKRNPKTFIF